MIDRYRDYKYGYVKSFNESILTDESFFSEFFESMTMTNAKIKIEKKIFLIVFLKSFMILEKWITKNLYVVMPFFMKIT